MIEEHYKGTLAISADSAETWRNWLSMNHQVQRGVWLIFFKKDSGIPTVNYSDAVDQALCFGWIDSKPNKRDELSSYRYFSPRNPKSNWSKVNKEKIARLEKEGALARAGKEMVVLAKENGTWNALDDVENLVIPDDLMMAFQHEENALSHWNDFPRSVKRSILEWILNAKKPETRSRRIQETAQKAGKNERANQFRK